MPDIPMQNSRIKKIKKRYSQIPNELISDLSISNGAFRVMSYMMSKPETWKFMNSEIQKTLGISAPKTISRYFKELINSGWLRRFRTVDENGKYNGGFVYELHYEKQKPNDTFCVIREDVSLHKTCNTYINTNTTSNTELFSSKRKIKEKLKIEIPQDIHQTAYQDFLDFRREIKKPVTPLAAKKHFNFLRTLNHEQQKQSIDNSIRSGWTGLFEPKRQARQPAISTEQWNSTDF